MGGTCVIRGCVPKKLMVYASAFSSAFADAAGFGWTVGETSFDWAKLIAAKDAEIARLEGLYASGLKGAGVTVVKGRATVRGPHEVMVGGRLTTARCILIATGGAPSVPDIPGRELAITSNEVFDLPTRPRRVVIVGGGYIGCEFAGIFNGLGSRVSLLYRGDMILRGFDDDVRRHVSQAMEARGVGIAYGVDVESLERRSDGIEVRVEGGASIVADAVLYATGRRPNTAGLGLEALGLQLGPGGAVPVDAWSQTAIPSIYAVGDVTDRLQLTPVAIREGHAFADTVFGAKASRADHDCVATAVFTQPEIGTVGLTEAQARARGDVEIYRAAFRPMLNILAGRDERMLMKLVVDKATRRVLGCHVVGPAAGEMIQTAAIAVRMGATKEDFDATVAVHPTAAEELVTMRTPAA